MRPRALGPNRLPVLPTRSRIVDVFDVWNKDELGREDGERLFEDCYWFYKF